MALVNLALIIEGARRDLDEAERLHKEALQIRVNTWDRYGVLQSVGLLAAMAAKRASDGSGGQEAPEAQHDRKQKEQQRKEQLIRAAVLLGAEEAIQEGRKIPRPIVDREWMDRAEEIARAGLAGLGLKYEELKKIGATLPESRAVALALGKESLSLVLRQSPVSRRRRDE